VKRTVLVPRGQLDTRIDGPEHRPAHGIVQDDQMPASLAHRWLSHLVPRQTGKGDSRWPKSAIGCPIPPAGWRFRASPRPGVLCHPVAGNITAASGSAEHSRSVRAESSRGRI
jgi:hypothetical protein